MNTIFIHGLPVAQPRTKATSRGKFAGVYTPKTADVWKACIIQAIRADEWVISEGPLDLTATFMLPRPKSHYRANGDLKKSAPIMHTKKPDLDNLIKAVMDAMTQAGVWRDDSEVSTIRSSKRYASAPNKTGVRIILT